jgi:hypothetical protein
MNKSLHRLCFAAAAALLFAASVGRADEAPATELPTLRTPLAPSQLARDAVRAELAQARTDGRLDRPGEAGAVEDGAAASEPFNATQALVMAAQLAYEERLAGSADDMPDLASYIEEGVDGPVLVLLLFDPDAAVEGSEALALAGLV